VTLRIENWTLADIADAVGGEVVGEAHGVCGVSTDTRTIAAGELFVALSGENFDGHDYVEVAARAGAGAALVSRRVETSLPCIVVEDTLDALQRLGAALFDEARRDGAFSIALTGSNGKTTTKELLVAVWSTISTVHANVGNLNNHIGVPLTLCAIPQEAQTIVVEMGANQFGDISELIALAPADVRIITSIGHAHIEGFGSIEGVRRAKSEIFEQSTPQTLAVVPHTERGRLNLGSFRGTVDTVGPAKSGADIEVEPSSPDVVVRGRGLEYHLRLPLPGAHNAHNLATALGTMLVADRRPDRDRLDVALRELVLPGGRWRTVERGDWTFLDDAYNANPSSVRASWDGFVEMRERSGEVASSDVVGVFGEMLELGDDAEALHADTARWIAQRGGADVLAFVGAFAGAMAAAAGDVGETTALAFEDPDRVAAWLAGHTPGTVFLKASRGQRLERIIEHFPADADRDEA
jgi:UDP-N-acetylmuramoyl-tripeptide--D-alanyl-D-alanine ligase